MRLLLHGMTSKGGTKEKYPLYPIKICGQTIILTNEKLAIALLSLPEKNREIIFLYFFGHYRQLALVSKNVGHKNKRLRLIVAKVQP